MTTYSDLDAFYRDNEHRRHSRELDFGVHWISGKNRMRRYRLTWVADTGEVIFVGPIWGVRVLASVPKEETIERVLEGWAEKCGEEGSVEWVCTVLRAYVLVRGEDAPWYGELVDA